MLKYEHVQKDEKEEKLYLIWSHEHQLWWRENSRGYTNSIIDAGIYSEDEATLICEKSGIGRKFTKDEKINIESQINNFKNGPWSEYFDIKIIRK